MSTLSFQQVERQIKDFIAWTQRLDHEIDETTAEDLVQFDAALRTSLRQLSDLPAYQHRINALADISQLTSSTDPVASTLFGGIGGLIGWYGARKVRDERNRKVLRQLRDDYSQLLFYIKWEGIAE